MEKFFEAGTLTDDELKSGIRKAILARIVTPVFAVSAATLVGISTLMDAIVAEAPTPADRGSIKGRASAEPDAAEVERSISDTEPIDGYVFRTVVETFGKITILKIFSGVFKADANVYNIGKNANERLGPLHYVMGKTLEKVPEAHAGDIIAVSKLKETSTRRHALR